MAVTSAASNSGFDFTVLNGSASTKDADSTTEARSNFLKLLTTQLQNQDPLNPMDNAQMTSQIAQLNMVDGINKMNNTMQTLLASMSGSQTVQAASMVNHGVLVPGASLTLANGAAVGGYALDTAADNVKATIKDANGLVVRTLNLGAGKVGINSFSWDGKADSGAAAAAGEYTVSVEAAQGGKDVKATAMTLGIVSSVTNASDGLIVNVNGRGSFKLAEIKQIF